VKYWRHCYIVWFFSLFVFKPLIYLCLCLSLIYLYFFNSFNYHLSHTVTQPEIHFRERGIHYILIFPNLSDP
jgi:hypothetical protein